MRDPVIGIRRQGARHIHQVSDHRRGRRKRARTGAVIECRPDRIALHQNGVHHPVDVCDETPLGDQRRVHPQLDPIAAATGDAEVFDAIAQLGGIGDVQCADLRDALGKTALELERNTEGQRAENGQLVRRVDAFDVEARIGLRIAQRLGLGEDIGEVATLVAHLGQDEVTGPVDNACDPIDVVCRQAFAQGLDDGNATGDGRLEAHHDTALARRSEDLVAVPSDQRLVGRDHVLAVLDRPEHQLERRRIAPDQLDDDLDLGILDDGEGVRADPPDRLEPLDLIRIIVPCRCMRDLDPATGATRDLRSIARQDRHSAAADRPQAQKSDLHRFHSCPLIRKSVGRRVRQPVRKLSSRRATRGGTSL